jgi:hypothetical protein
MLFTNLLFNIGDDALGFLRLDITPGYMALIHLVKYSVITRVLLDCYYLLRFKRHLFHSNRSAELGIWVR